ncbi:MAG TPA: hypothetical protein VEX60_02575 [Pyrinomonadaceae bacterium]|nr:hypothetical protein [Pyrinomonadaceae bacterium]
MATEIITLEIDSEAAQAFKAVSANEREKLQVLLGIWLKEFARADSASLKATMDEMSEKARGRGLTSEIEV